jgi:1,3-beta-glucan synthase
MSGHPQGQAPGHGQDQGRRDYDDGYGPQGNTDSYYQDDQQYYDNHGQPNNRGGQQHGEGYYDESYVLTRSVPL